METTMEREAVYRPVGFGGAIVRQLRFLWLSRRPLLMLVALLGVLTLTGEPWGSSRMARLLEPWPIWLIVAGPFWALAVWWNEGPDDRLFHWSQPVSRRSHSLARVVAGAVWLWVLLALLVVAGVLYGVLDGNVWQLGELGPAAWVNLFTGPLLGYLGVSLLTLPSDYPFRWFFGILFLAPVIGSLLDRWFGLRAVLETLLKPISADWGLGATLIGALGVAIRDVNRESLLRAGMAVPQQAQQAQATIDLGTWWLVTPLWLLGFAALVFLVASWHPDRFPRWQGLRR